ncbi:hypothetical protein N7492_009436 [Penicillium capsulatum]|uniref:Succinyl-diaminopimelate desuccinylase n=1 Tax=Penicillium capsulatum TaxID=69766 RepID=A0A9W9HTZ2_9EURO|nr:hypothetical protein N7492_009436 [Penicillium capsulatum]KAJ6106826.1 hypothetical protein N7512_010343 [Penicillium capsulatum]
MSSRRPIYINPDAAHAHSSRSQVPGVRDFHQSLPKYAPTPLVPLPELATELGVKAIFVKDESNRLGLPAFKILGASWGCFRAVARHLGVSATGQVSLQEVSAEAQKTDITLVTATEGNHGRAVAFMARLLGIRAQVFVPRMTVESVRAHIASEGAAVSIVQGNYDHAVQEASNYASRDDALLIQDTAFEGYEDVPAWIVEGYATMMAEAEEQVSQHELSTSMMVTPVGVGSLAHAVVKHCKSRNTSVVAVEPDSAPCLSASLRAGKPVTVNTIPTIMDGMNCGTVSATAWPDLQRLVDACVSISCWESHCAVQYLQSKSVPVGPCGGASLAAIRRIAEEIPSLLNRDSVVVLLATEGAREYTLPRDVSPEDSVDLTQALTQINSSNPTLSVSDGAGESEIAAYIETWFAHRDIEHHRVESVTGRPSVIGILRGSGEGKSLMFNGHIDTVSISSYDENLDPLSGSLGMKDGQQVVFGRGSLDMKGGLAAALSALATIKASGTAPSGDIIVAAVSDEEDASQGTRDILAAGWRADAAVVPEPTNGAIATAHKGFVWVEVDILGVAAHGSNPSAGVDAIIQAGWFLRALEQYRLPVDDVLGQASMHCGLIRGGEEPSSYPGKCTLTIEFRTVPVQTEQSILASLSSMLQTIAKEDPRFKYNKPRVTMSRPSAKMASEHPLVRTAVVCAKPVYGCEPTVVSVPFWCDAAFLAEAGIPSIVLGPSGAGLHSREEWVEVQSLQQMQALFVDLTRAYCDSTTCT